MAGVHEAMLHHKRQGYTIIGITNQGGCDTINLNPSFVTTGKV
ncbi:hypothetical protein [Nostoc sp. PA-18-2419]|nr:hypothetical protein [Nostoc sp. PA-18-2419]